MYSYIWYTIIFTHQLEKRMKLSINPEYPTPRSTDELSKWLEGLGDKNDKTRAIAEQSSMMTYNMCIRLFAQHIADSKTKKL